MQRQEAELEVAEMKVFFERDQDGSGMNLSEEQIMADVWEINAEKTYLVSFAILKRDHDSVGERTPRLELPVKRPGGRPQKRFMGVVKDNMGVVGVNKEDVDDRSRWRRTFCCGDP